MKAPNPTTVAEKTRESKFPLFEEWLLRNPSLSEFLPKAEWFAFFQNILKTLKTRNRWFLNSFIDETLPVLAHQPDSQNIVIKAFQHLRTLLISNIIENPNIKRPQQRLLIREILNLFDQIIFPVQQAAVQQVSRTSQDEFIRTGQCLHKLPCMAYTVAATRFMGKGYLNELLLDWTGIPGEEQPAVINWQALIHPEDWQRVDNWFQKKITDRQNFYVMSYRLKNKQDDWHHIYDFGRIIYDEAGNVQQCIGIITEANASPGNMLSPVSLPDIFQCMIDTSSDFAFVLDRNGKLIYATNFLLFRLNLFPGVQESPEEHLWDSITTPFFELLTSTNKIEAEKTWQTLLSEPLVSTTMRLQLPENRKYPEQEVEFYCYPVQKPFQKTLYIFWGNLISPESPRLTHNQQQARLIRHARALSEIQDPNAFYPRLIEPVMDLLPQCQTVAVFIKTSAGYILKAAKGLKPQFQKNKFLLPASFLDPFTSDHHNPSSPHGMDIIPGEDFENRLQKVLPEKDFSLWEKSWGVQESAWWLTGMLKGQEHVTGIVLAGFTRKDVTLTPTQQNLFALLLLHASSVLNSMLIYRKLQDIETAYRTIIEKSLLAVIILQNDELKLFNPRYLELTGLTQQQAMDTNFWQLIHPNDANELLKKLGELEELSGYWEHEFRMVPIDEREIRCRGAFIKIRYHQKPAYLCQLMDISYLKDLEEQLIQSKKLENVGLLTAGIAHDFNNLLSAIIPSAQMIVRNATSPELQRYAENIFKLASRAGQISRQLTSYVPMQEDMKELLDINQLLRDTKELLRNVVGPDITIGYQLTGTLPLIEGNRNQLLQMLINLVIRSKESIAGDGEIVISTRRKQVTAREGIAKAIHPGDYIVLSIRDKGTGVADDIRRHLFEPFLTSTETARGDKAGLSMVYAISQKHGGYVSMQSEDQKGNTFKVYLPVAAEAPIEEASIGRTNSAAPGGKVLVVDDETYLLEVLTSMLNLMGYDYYQASSGKEAVEIYRAHRDEISLVILDYVMPGMSGEETLHILKESNPDLRVILCTGYTEQREIAPLLKDPRVTFLPKPFTIELLSKELSNTL